MFSSLALTRAVAANASHQAVAAAAAAQRRPALAHQAVARLALQSALFSSSSSALPSSKSTSRASQRDRLAFIASSPSASTTRRPFTSSHPRWAANPQAGKPTSENVSHMIKNIKEEAGQVASSLSSSIAGQAGSGDEKRSGGKGFSGAGDILKDARSITAEMTKQMPQPAIVWGGAGIIPYVTTAGASIYLARQAWLVSKGIDTHLDFDTAQALLLHAQNVQITFGALILSFLGALHWGFEWSKYGGVIGNRRYVLGLVPVVAAWPTLVLNPSLALVSQWATFVVMWFLDLKATNAGWVPKWYSTYRFWLTLFVGSSIIATLAGTRYYSTDAAASGQRAPSTKLLESRKDEYEHGGKVVRPVKAEVDAKDAGEQGDGYVKLTNIRKQQEAEEERKKKEAEKKQKKEDQAVEQETKLAKQMEKADAKDA